MAWLKIHTNITRNPKTARLARLLKIKRVEAVGYLVTLWTTVLDVCEDGDLSKYTNQGIADLASWEGDENQFFAALDEAGWLDVRGVRRGKRFVYLHDWYEHVERYLQSKYKNSPQKWENLKAVLQQHASFKPRKPVQMKGGVADADEPDGTEEWRQARIAVTQKVKRSGERIVLTGEQPIPEDSPSTEWPRVVTDRYGIDRLVHAPGSTADEMERQEARRAANDAEIAYMMGGRPQTLPEGSPSTVAPDEARMVPIKGEVDGGSATRPARVRDSDASDASLSPVSDGSDDRVRGTAVVSDLDGRNERVVQVQERLFDTEGLTGSGGGRGDEMKGEKSNKKRGSLVKAGDIKVKHMDCIFLTNDELSKLRVIFSQNYMHKIDSCGDDRLQYGIQKLNDYIMGRNKTRTYKSHFHVLRGWVLKSVWEDEQRAFVRFAPKVAPAYRNDVKECRDCGKWIPDAEWAAHDCAGDRVKPIQVDTVQETITALRGMMRSPVKNDHQSPEDRSGGPNSAARRRLRE